MTKCKPNLCVISEICGGFCGCLEIEISNCCNQKVAYWSGPFQQQVFFSLSPQKLYWITVKTARSSHALTPCCICRQIYCHCSGMNTQYFIFKPYFVMPALPHAKIEFKLTDAYYPNLPISEGVLTLWPYIQ